MCPTGEIPAKTEVQSWTFLGVDDDATLERIQKILSTDPDLSEWMFAIEMDDYQNRFLS